MPVLARPRPYAPTFVVSIPSPGEKSSNNCVTVSTSQSLCKARSGKGASRYQFGRFGPQRGSQSLLGALW